MRVNTDGGGYQFVTINTYKNLISFKQRESNECGYYSLISVILSLIKENFNDLDEDFMKLLIGKASSLSITNSGAGISGNKLSKLVNDYFFEGDNVCAFNKDNMKQPRITMMLTHGHWIGHIPSSKKDKDYLLEPFSCKVEKELIKEATKEMRNMLKQVHNNDKDLSVNINKAKLFRFYSQFTKEEPIVVKYRSLYLTTIGEGSDERSSSVKSSSSGRRSSRRSWSSSRRKKKKNTYKKNPRFYHIILRLN